MSLHVHAQPVRTPWRQLCRSVLLPLLLLLAQHGALLHELRHYAAPEAASGTDGRHPQQHAQPCDLCLAYAPLAASAAPGDIALPLLAGLRFEAATATSAPLRSTERAAPRNRGPPATA